MDKDFFLPNQLKDKYPDKIDIKVNFDDFKYEEGMIPVNYEYNLDKDDLNFLVKCIGENAGLKDEGSVIYKFLLDIYNYEDDLYSALEDYLEHRNSDNLNKVRNKLKEFCKSKAYSEFLEAFKYWVDEEDLEDYFETEEITDFD